MTIDEAIKHAREVVEDKRESAKIISTCNPADIKFMEHGKNCEKCANEHEQLAEWLEELKKLREGRNEIPIATITINNEALQKMVDEKVKDIELDIQGIRNKAIDDFVKECEKKLTDMILSNQGRLDFASGLAVASRMLDDVAEQLKEGR